MTRLSTYSTPFRFIKQETATHQHTYDKTISIVEKQINLKRYELGHEDGRKDNMKLFYKNSHEIRDQT
jgi:hypothetical protein